MGPILGLFWAYSEAPPGEALAELMEAHKGYGHIALPEGPQNRAYFRPYLGPQTPDWAPILSPFLRAPAMPGT